jgi:hypothetical protein
MGIGVKAVVTDHVFAYSLCRALGLCPDLAVDVESCVTPAEDLLDHIPDHRTEIPILLLETILIFLKEPPKIIIEFR